MKQKGNNRRRATNGCFAFRGTCIFPLFAGSVTANSESIFQELFSAGYTRLCRYALIYMQDEHSAEDVVQDTFIRIWETKRDLITSPDIRNYLVTAVRITASPPCAS